MIAAILLGGEGDAATGGVVEGDVLGQLGQRIAHGAAAVPDLACLPGGGVCYENRPGLGTLGNEWQPALRAAAADECQLRAVWGPARQRVVIEAGSDPADLGGAERVD